MIFSFDHERLWVYQSSIEFVVWAAALLERVPKHLSAWDQLDRASESIPLNIAEGNGRHTAPDRCRFFDTARGSGLECAACLDVLVAKKIVTEAECLPGKELLRSMVSMLVGLIRSSSPDRLYEDEVEYRVDGQDSPSKRIPPKPTTARAYFGHERLEAYQEALKLVACTAEILEHLPRSLSLLGKLDRTSTAIPLNIAEGNGKFTAADRCRFFDHARGAALGCAACLDTLLATKNLAEAEICDSKAILHSVVSLLVGLTRSNSLDRVHEECVEYRVSERGGD